MKKVTSLIAEITAASQEQAQGIAPKPAPVIVPQAVVKKAEPQAHIPLPKDGKRKSNGHAEEGWRAF